MPKHRTSIDAGNPPDNWLKVWEFRGHVRFSGGGGIFVAFVQTGRHTPERQVAWPISRLSGYEVTDLSKSVFTKSVFTPTEPYE